MRYAYRVLVRNLKGRPRQSLEKWGGECLDWIQLNQVRVQWRAFLKTDEVSGSVIKDNK
jgi:hypothetical protein